MNDDDFKSLSGRIMELAARVKALEALVINITVQLGIRPPIDQPGGSPRNASVGWDDDEGDAFHGVAVPKGDGE